LARRQKGEGSILKNMRDGVQIGWRASIDIGYNNEGKRIRKQFYGKTQKEVKEKLNEYKKQMLLGSVLNKDNLTFEH
jgi:hypothetical protein